MNQGDKPDLLIYHGPNCLDGFACAWAVNQRWPDVAMHVGVYDQDPPDVTGLRVLIADFSYPEDVLRAMAEAALSITVLDHHKTAGAWLPKLLNENVIQGLFDMKRSGAALAWEYVWGAPNPPKLIEHIQDRDLWKWECDGTAEITAVAYSLDQTPTEEAFKAWTALAKRIEAGERGLVITEGAAIMRQRKRDLESVMRAGTREMIIGGKRVPVCNAPFFWASEIGHELAQQSQAGFAGTYMDMPNGRQFSLRRNEGAAADVSAIAEEYGGGGHPGAAGFMAPAGWEGDIDQDEPVETIRLQPGKQVKVGEG